MAPSALEQHHCHARACALDPFACGAIHTSLFVNEPHSVGLPTCQKATLRRETARPGNEPRVILIAVLEKRTV